MNYIRSVCDQIVVDKGNIGIIIVFNEVKNE